MAAVLIKQIYSTDINSCFTTIVPMWDRVPHLWGTVPMHCLEHATPRSPWLPLLWKCVSSVAGSNKDFRTRILLSYFSKMLRNLKTHKKNLSTLGLISITRAVEVLTIATKTICYSTPDFNWTHARRHTYRTWDWIEFLPLLKWLFTQISRHFHHPINTYIISSMLIYHVKYDLIRQNAASNPSTCRLR